LKSERNVMQNWQAISGQCVNPLYSTKRTHTRSDINSKNFKKVIRPNVVQTLDRIKCLDYLEVSVVEGSLASFVKLA